MTDYRCIACDDRFPRRYMRDDHENDCEAAIRREAAQWIVESERLAWLDDPAEFARLTGVTP